jgi:hypothetical protein
VLLIITARRSTGLAAATEAGEGEVILVVGCWDSGQYQGARQGYFSKRESSRQSIDGGKVVRLRYVRRPFGREPDFGVTSVNYDVDELLARSCDPGVRRVLSGVRRFPRK